MLDLKNPPPQEHRAGTQFYNFTMRIHGNVFDNSPGAQGYFEMPKVCHYERNHSVLAMFNASRGEVEFTILNTHSDKIFCPRPDKKEDAPVDRCTGAAPCYQGLNTKKFTGRFRLGPRRVDDVASTQHHLELVLFFPYKHFGATSWSDADERAKSTYVVQSSIPSQVNSWATKKESQDLPVLAHGRAADLERTFRRVVSRPAPQNTLCISALWTGRGRVHCNGSQS